MKNSGWLVVAGIFALMLAACGSGDGTEGGNDGSSDPSGSNDAGTVNPDDTATCGNGTCEAGEGCSSCENDCACNAADFKACRNNACVDWDSINPLLKKLPGHWTRLEPGPDEADVNVDVDRPACEFNGHPQGDPGDACVQGFSPAPMTISGQNLSYRAYGSTDHAEGQVLNEGTRVEFTYTDTGGMPHAVVYEKQ